jgi:hypothetical protein
MCLLPELQVSRHAPADPLSQKKKKKKKKKERKRKQKPPSNARHAFVNG